MKIRLLSIAIFLSVSAFAQHSLQGHVIDGETNTPLPGANVFIAKTTKGVSTSADGAFLITDLPALHYQLVISFIGYETQVLDVVPGKPISYKIILKPSAERLAEVVVRARSSRAEWLANLAIFKEHFIGLSENSRYCNIENTQILDFENKDGILKAIAEGNLNVVNTGLGYRLKVVIDKYEYNQLNIRLFYQGNLLYEPLTPADEVEKKRWAQNRLKAYYGSEMHFLRALHHKRLLEEGYVFNLLYEVPKGKYGTSWEGVADTTIRMRSKIFNNKNVKVHTLYKYSHILDSLSTPTEPILNYSGKLEVKYMNEAEGFEYTRHHEKGGSNTPQTSLVILRSPAIVQPTGQLYPQDAIETQGYWSWELIAEGLPLDYDPGEDLKTVGEE